MYEAYNALISLQEVSFLFIIFHRRYLHLFLYVLLYICLLFSSTLP